MHPLLKRAALAAATADERGNRLDAADVGATQPAQTGDMKRPDEVASNSAESVEQSLQETTGKS